MNPIQKLKEIPRKTFAKVLLRVKNTNWWKETLLEEVNRITEKRIETARKLLPAITQENEWCAIAFENLVSHLKNEYSVKTPQESIPAHLLNLGALVSRNLITLNQIIPVVTLTSPVGMALIMRTVANNVNSSLSVVVLREAVEAKTKKFSTRISLNHGVESDISYLDAVAKEMAGEIIQDVIDQLKVLAGIPDEVLIESWMQQPEAYDKMLQVIETNEIRVTAETRRGRKMVLVTSKAILDVLIDQDAIDLNPEASLVPTSIDMAGTLKKSGNPVYVTPHIGTGEILIGYRVASNIDTGCIFMPYILATSKGTEVDPHTFEPRETFITRGSLVMDKDSRKYYRLIDASKVLSQNSVK